MHGLFFLYDDDCGICTKIARIAKFIQPKFQILPMHYQIPLINGYKIIGEVAYWTSFHIVKNGNWSTSSDAILAFASSLPGGKFIDPIVKTPPVFKFLKRLLKTFQSKRKEECNFQMASNAMIGKL